MCTTLGVYFALGQQYWNSHLISATGITYTVVLQMLFVLAITHTK